MKVKTIAEDYRMVLEEAKSMGCTKIKALYNIPLETMEIIVQSLENSLENGWIPCSEALPAPRKKKFGNKQKRENVLVTLRNGIVKEMTFEFETKEFWEHGDENHLVHWQQDTTDSECDVVAWKRMPKPYKEDNTMVES